MRSPFEKYTLFIPLRPLMNCKKMLCLVLRHPLFLSWFRALPIILDVLVVDIWILQPQINIPGKFYRNVYLSWNIILFNVYCWRMKPENSKSEWKKSFFIYVVIENPTGARTNINAKWEAIHMRQTVILSRDQNMAKYHQCRTSLTGYNFKR